MDDASPSTGQSPATPGVLRIETGAGESRTIEPGVGDPSVSATTPALAGFIVLVGLTIALLGALWLRKRPRREPTQDEVFACVAAAIGATAKVRADARALGAISADGVPSSVGLLMSAPARGRLSSEAAGCAAR